MRTDASLRIGSGHVMRCLTLARELAGRGVKVGFCCRAFDGHLMAEVSTEFTVHALPSVPVDGAQTDERQWLGVPQSTDAADTQQVIVDNAYDAVLVDHYAIDTEWESQIAAKVKWLCVIDDLANRDHQADLLLDQNLARDAADYRARVPDHTLLLCGTRYALLRDEFRRLRADQSQRLPRTQVQRLLITFGGADIDNLTTQAITALAASGAFQDAQVEVVLGASNPHRSSVEEALMQLQQPTQLASGVNDMGARMMAADLCIGAAGSTSWERCVLGLPALVTTQADNQAFIASQLQQHGAVEVIACSNFSDELALALQRLERTPQALTAMSNSAAKLCDGQGAERVAEAIMSLDKRGHYADH